jgi:hypothetical protein
MLKAFTQGYVIQKRRHPPTKVEDELTHKMSSLICTPHPTGFRVIKYEE